MFRSRIFRLRWEDFAVIQQEIVMMRDCKHANIVAYYGSYLRRDKLWIFTGPLAENKIAYVCRETLHGLYYLHQRGKMHRDIKGANILLTDDGSVKLADFGVSAQITATMCKRKSFIGTPYWMAPEVAAVERKGGYNQQCDIWAVGITAIEFAEMQPPMFDLHPMRSPVFHNFLKAALTKNPKKRPSADKLLEHPFLQSPELDKRLGRDLLDSVYSPSGSSTHYEDLMETDEDGITANVPRRISSKKSSQYKQRTKSEIKMENVNFPPPFVPEMKSEQDHEETEYETAGEGTLCGDEAKTLLEKVDEELRKRGHRSSLVEMEGNLQYTEQATLPLESQRVLPSELFYKRIPEILDYQDPDHDHSVSPDDVADDSRHDMLVEGLVDYMGTLVPGMQPPRGDELPPELPPKQKHRPLSLVNGSSGVTSNDRPRSPPPPPPPRKKHTPPKPMSNGLPPTPKVHILDPKNLQSMFHVLYMIQLPDQIILIGAEEGIYTLNLNEIHEGSMELLHARRCVWLYTIKDVLMSLSGKTPSLYRHDLAQLHSKHRFSLPVNKIPEKLMPRENKESYNTSKRSTGNRRKPKNMKAIRTLDYNTFENPIFLPLTTFEMLITPESEYPLLCVGVGKGCNWFSEPGSVCLQDSVLAFYKYGMQGRSFKANEVTQEISDKTRIFRLLGSDRVVCLESRPTNDQTAHSNLYVLAGHENTY
ncbi:hypothetical protein LSH36_167g09019 [Paralvinella palmiformis]|uniref:Protein kinase domain-containing protein n=1 Tax=Paralvinella palmiformis TaxID=53620 RepID=A0AAD9JSU8_9ANNE|nr:hypothetical protein LSH36_167g09019 [Paralvinella palmiformis]